jgi:hypothetical protein
MQRDMSYYMLATFADQFRNNPMQDELRQMRAQAGVQSKAEWQGANLADMEPEEMEGLLADTVLKEFKSRLSRIGIEYQTPERP